MVSKLKRWRQVASASVLWYQCTRGQIGSSRQAPQSTAEDKVAAYRVLVARAEASDAGSEEAFAKAFSRAFTADRV